MEGSDHLQQEQGLAPVFPSHVSSFRCVSVPRLAEQEAPHGQTDIGVLETVAQRSGGAALRSPQQSLLASPRQR